MKKLLLLLILFISVNALAGTCYTVKNGVKTYWQTTSTNTQVKRCYGNKTPVPAPVPTPPPVPQPSGSLMPMVDISKNMIPAVGFSTLLVYPTTQKPDPSDVGAFRISCKPSHMLNDDPIVFPNQESASHHHTFYGNTTTNNASNLMALSTTGNSTCNGGIMNRSAYWHPSMINTVDGSPIVPTSALFYYKTDNPPVTMPPKGLRMIAGDSKATTGNGKDLFMCVPPDGHFKGWFDHIPTCAVGDNLQMVVDFPQCWDGINLDSPNHKDHMAFTANGGCPVSHPISIPGISITVNFKIDANTDTTKWRLSSDNYATSLPGGYSAHADWANGWNETFMQTFIDNCLNKKLDCAAHLLGDGRFFDSM